MKSILIGLTALTCHLALAAPQGSPPTQAQVAFQVITQQSDLRTFGSEETFKNLKATDLVAHGLSDGHLLYQLSVAAGAYNTATAFAILEDQTTARLLTFSEPILYKADGKPVQVAGWTTKTSLMGGDYSQTIKNFKHLFGPRKRRLLQRRHLRTLARTSGAAPLRTRPHV